MGPLTAFPKPEDFWVISSITMKQIGFDGASIKVDRVIPVANVWGRCDKVITSQPNAKGETFTGFEGSFYAENVQTKGLFRSHRAFFPSGLRNALQKALLKKLEQYFMAQLAVVPADSPTGYCWIGSLKFS